MEAMTKDYWCECCHVDPRVERLAQLELKGLVVHDLILVSELTHFVDGGLVGYAYRGYDQIWDFVSSRGGDGKGEARGNIRGE